jgi:hypothetical protein
LLHVPFDVVSVPPSTREEYDTTGAAVTTGGGGGIVRYAPPRRIAPPEFVMEAVSVALGAEDLYVIEKHPLPPVGRTPK